MSVITNTHKVKKNLIPYRNINPDGQDGARLDELKLFNYVLTDEQAPYRVEIYTAQGQLVQVAGKGQSNVHQLITVPVNGSRLGNGVYFVRLITQQITRVQTMIIHR